MPIPIDRLYVGQAWLQLATSRLTAPGDSMRLVSRSFHGSPINPNSPIPLPLPFDL